MNEDIQNPQQKIKYRPDLICKSKVKKLALALAQANPAPSRAKMFTRVGEDFYKACEAKLREFMKSRIKSQPSKGKTLN